MNFSGIEERKRGERDETRGGYGGIGKRILEMNRGRNRQFSFLGIGFGAKQRSSNFRAEKINLVEVKLGKNGEQLIWL